MTAGRKTGSKISIRPINPMKLKQNNMYGITNCVFKNLNFIPLKLECNHELTKQANTHYNF